MSHIPEGSTLLSSLFKSDLNSYGHPFQYAVIQTAIDVNQERKSNRIPEASEFPIEVQNRHGRIDFVLASYRNTAQPFRYLVAECKRVNPAFSDWVFVQAPFTANTYAGPEVIQCEALSIVGSGSELVSDLYQLHTGNAYHHAYAVKVKNNEKKGDPWNSGNPTEAIEAAATQVTLGVNGLIECFSKRIGQLSNTFFCYFVPVIFTTANLWVSDIDLSGTDLTTGKIEENINLKRAPWLWLQYPVSPGLKHSLRQSLSQQERAKGEIATILRTDYLRSIAVVSADAIEGFLASQLWQLK